MGKFRIRWPRDHTKDLTSLPAPAFRRLMLAVFFSMGSAIICTDLMDSLQRPLWWTLTRACVIGVLTAASLAVAGRGRRALLIALPMVILIITATLVTARSLPPNRLLFEPGLEQLRKRLALEGALSVLGMSLGYAIFLRTIGTEVSRHIRTRAELVLAEQVQQSLAPPLALANAGYEIDGRSIPSSQMGGDLLDAVEGDGNIACYIADVAGHGIQAGVLMAMVKSSVRTALMKAHSMSDLMCELNQVLAGVKTGPAAYVAFTCARCLEGGVVEYSIAGAGPILHYDAQSQKVETLAMEQFPLGLFANAKFESRRLQTRPGDLLALLTDGVPETADSRDAQFGNERVAQMLASQAHAPLRAIIETIFSAARRHGSQTDDETLVLIRTSSISRLH